MSSDINVRHPESRRRIAEQCVLLLRPSATPEQRTRITDHILVLCNYRIAIEEKRMTPSLLSELIAIHSSCVHDQEGRCPLLVSVQSLCWEINLALGLGNEEDRAFKRYDPICAARPLGAERFDLSEDRLLDVVYEILQLNRALLKNGSLEHEDHKAYFTQHLEILKGLSVVVPLRVSRDTLVEPGGIAQSRDGKLWRVVSVDDEKVVLKKVRVWKSVEVKWAEWARGWELKFP
jgi:hypothetical protein